MKQQCKYKEFQELGTCILMDLTFSLSYVSMTRLQKYVDFFIFYFIRFHGFFDKYFRYIYLNNFRPRYTDIMFEQTFSVKSNKHY